MSRDGRWQRRACERERQKCAARGIAYPRVRKPHDPERQRQRQLEANANRLRKVWQKVVRDDKVSYRQRMDAELAQKEAEHQKHMADLQRQLEQAQAAAQRNAEEAAQSAAEAARIAAEAAQAAKQTQIRHTEYRQAISSAVCTVKDLASAALAEEKTTTRTLDQQLSKKAPASRQLYASAEKMRNADRQWNRAVYYY